MDLAEFIKNWKRKYAEAMFLYCLDLVLLDALYERYLELWQRKVSAVLEKKTCGK